MDKTLTQIDRPTPSPEQHSTAVSEVAAVLRFYDLGNDEPKEVAEAIVKAVLATLSR